MSVVRTDIELLKRRLIQSVRYSRAPSSLNNGSAMKDGGFFC
jgi:hypothetical protein